MPRKTPPTNPPVAPPSTKLETAQMLAEMMATPGWVLVLVPSLMRRRDLLVKQIIDAQDPGRSFAAEISAVRTLNMLLNAQESNQKLLALLRKFESPETE